jgi:hypothetical protein
MPAPSGFPVTSISPAQSGKLNKEAGLLMALATTAFGLILQETTPSPLSLKVIRKTEPDLGELSARIPIKR